MLNGARKGKEAEREVAGLIQAWWRKLEPSCTFVRTPQSGGWSSTPVRAEFRACADLMTDAALFPFAVEVKRNERWTLENVMVGRASPVWEWWAQALSAAAKQGGEPLLVIRKSREPWYGVARLPYVKSVASKLKAHDPTFNDFLAACENAREPREPLYIFYMHMLLATDPNVWRR